MSKTAIRKALEAKLETILPKLVTVFENSNQSVPANTPYQIANLFFARPLTTGYGNAPYIQRGYLQISLMYPLGQGPGPAQARGDLLELAFFRGLSLAANGVTTVIEETPEVSGGEVEGDRFVVKVFVRFYSDIQNGV